MEDAKINTYNIVVDCGEIHGGFTMELNAKNHVSAIKKARIDFKKAHPSLRKYFKIVYFTEVNFFIENKVTGIRFILENKHNVDWKEDFRSVRRCLERN